MRNFLYTIFTLLVLSLYHPQILAQEAPNDFEAFRKLTSQLDELKQKKSKAHQTIIPRLEELIAASHFPYKNFLQSILADEYYAYYLSRLQILRENPPTDIDPRNYKTWNAELLSNKIRELYQHSLTPRKRLLELSTREYEALFLSSELASANHPNLYHVLASRALVFFQDSRGEIHKGDQAFRIRSRRAFVEADSFISLNFKPLDTLSTAYLAVKLYQDLLDLSRSYESPFPFVFTNIQRLKYVRRNSTGQLQRQRYANALQKMVPDYENHPAITEIKYELAKLYMERGQSYMPPGVKSFQWDYKAAYELCEEVIRQFPKTQSAQKCQKLIEIIRQKTLSVDVEEVQIPLHPFRIKLNFRNVERIYVRIVHLSQALDQKLETLEGNQEGQLNVLRQANSVESWIQDLPSEQDFQMHAIELPIPELEAGKYILLIGDDPSLSTQGHAVIHARLRVSNLAVIKNQMKDKVHFRVVNRIDGSPISGVYVRQRDVVEDATTISETDIEGSYFVDMSGGIKNYQLVFKLDNDSISQEARKRSSFSSASRRLISRVYSDSRVYRPGGTIQFRGLSYFHDRIPVSAITDSTMYVRMINADQEIIRDTTVEINQYGAFSGSFRLPKNETGHYMLIAQGGSYLFQIKGPEPEHFDVYLQVPEKDYDYWDSVVVTGKIIPFLGADMPETTIRYRVIRQSLFPYWYSDTWWRPELANERVLAARGKTSTDSTGNFQLSFPAIPDLELGVDEAVIYNYTIYVNATSLAGEQHSDTVEVRIGRPKLAIKMEAPVVSEVGEPLEMAITSRNLFGKPLAVEGRLRVFPLTAPSNTYRERQWSQPDMHILDEASYHEMFPNDVYGYEDDFRSWKAEEAIVDTMIHTASDSLIVLKELTKHLAGKYRIRFDVKDADGMPLKVVEYATRYNSYSSVPPVPTILDYSFSSLEGQPGETIQLGLFTSEPSLWVSIEWGTFDVMDSVKAINLNSFIQSISIPIKDTHKGDLFVRITAIIHNQFRTYTQRIRVPWLERQLDFDYVSKKGQGINALSTINQDVELLPETIYMSFPHWNRFPYRFSPQNRIFRPIRSLGFSIARAGMISNDWRVNFGNEFLLSETYHWWANEKKVYASLGDLQKLDDDIWSNERTRMARLNIQGGGGPSALIGLEHDLKARLQSQYTSHLIAGPTVSEKIPRTYIPESFYPSFLQPLDGKNGSFSLAGLNFPLLGKWKIRTVAHDANLRTDLIEKDTLIFKPLEAHIRIPDSLKAGNSWDCYLRVYNYKEQKDTVEISFTTTFYSESNASEKDFDTKKVVLSADNGFSKLHYPIDLPRNLDSIQLAVEIAGLESQVRYDYTIPVVNPDLTSSLSQVLFLKDKRKLKTYFQPFLNLSEPTKEYELELATSPDYFAKPYLQNLYRLRDTDTQAATQRLFAFHSLKLMEPSIRLAKDEVKDLWYVLKQRQATSGLLSWQPDFGISEQLTMECMQIIGWIEEWLTPDWSQQPLADSLIYPAIRSLDSLLRKQRQYEEIEDEFWDYLGMRVLFSRIEFENEETKAEYDEIISRYQKDIDRLHTKGKLILALSYVQNGDEQTAKQILSQIDPEDILPESNFLEIASLWISISHKISGSLERDHWVHMVLTYLSNVDSLTRQEHIWSSQALILSGNKSARLPSFKVKVGKAKFKYTQSDVAYLRKDFSRNLSKKSSKIKLISKVLLPIWGKMTWKYEGQSNKITEDSGYEVLSEWVKEKSLLLIHINTREKLAHKVISYRCNPEIVPEVFRKVIELENTEVYAETSINQVKLYLDDLPQGEYTIEIPLVE